MTPASSTKQSASSSAWSSAAFSTSASRVCRGTSLSFTHAPAARTARRPSAGSTTFPSSAGSCSEPAAATATSPSPCATRWSSLPPPSGSPSRQRRLYTVVHFYFFDPAPSASSSYAPFAIIANLAVTILGFLLIGLIVMDWQTHLLPDAFTLTGIAAGLFLICTQAIFLGPTEDQVVLTRPIHITSAGATTNPGNVFLTGPEVSHRRPNPCRHRRRPSAPYGSLDLSRRPPSRRHGPRRRQASCHDRRLPRLLAGHPLPLLRRPWRQRLCRIPARTGTSRNALKAPFWQLSCRRRASSPRSLATASSTHIHSFSDSSR